MSRSAWPHVAIVAALCLGVCRDAGAQYFGRNKVEYVDFDFKVFETAHFDVYCYPHEEPAARLAARLAERWYARLSRVLRHELRTRQPLILYGSHPEFTQTNVVSGFLDEGTGGVTESARRRIVMPFGPTLAETDEVLGHEIVHAFQFDMLQRYGGRLAWPRWAIEGMAQYLALGAEDAHTSMWLRDAVAHDLLPARQSDAARRFSPYRYGHALWAYLAGRFGDDALGEILRAGRAGSFDRRIQQVTGVGLDQLFTEWRTAAHEQYTSPGPEPGPEHARAPRLRAHPRSRIQLGPALSADGRHVAFFSEQDRLALDLFVADAPAGTPASSRAGVWRKLATPAGSAKFESLQAIRSAASWNDRGDRVVFAAIERGRSSLVILDPTQQARARTIRLPQLGQILTPSWSPDGRAIAFSVLDGGVTDLYTYDLASGALRRLTNDAYADIQPTWAPDGGHLAFVTDRFTTDLTTLRFGASRLALIEIASGAVRPLRAIDDERVNHRNPQFGDEGQHVYFIADRGGISNVYRLDPASGAVSQITDVPGGVTGMVASSPALSVARHASALAFTSFRDGKYEIRLLAGEAALRGTPLDEATVAARSTSALPPGAAARGESLVAQLLRDDRVGLPETDSWQARPYTPALSLDRIGQPYVGAGGGPFGGFVRAGGSLGFGDLLGERRLSTMVQVGGRLRDVELGVHFLNRTRRWNWGGLVELEPSLRRLPRRQLTEVDGEPAIAQETQYFQRIQLRAAGLLAYPLSHARRLEFTAGVRHARYQRERRSATLSLETRRLLEESREDWGEPPATIGEVSAALVGDTAVQGPTGPIVGSRYRFEIAPGVGGLSSTRLLLDYRRYVMPVKPYTLAARVVHVGQYGPDADDPRVLPTFLGARYFVRGYGWSDIRCQWDAQGACAALEELLGSRLFVANVELRAPLLGLRERDIRYGPLPVEGFLFADSGTVWSRTTGLGGAEPVAPRAARRVVNSAGVGVRVNAMGLPIELAAVRAFDAPARGWSFDFSFRTGF